MGYFRRSGLLIHFRTERAFRQGLNDIPPNSGSPSVSLSIQRSVPSTTWHLMGHATKPQWQQLCQMTSPSSGTSLANTAPSDRPPGSSAVSLGAQPNRLAAPPLAANAASAVTVDPLTNERLETPIPSCWSMNLSFLGFSCFRKAPPQARGLSARASLAPFGEGA